MTSELLLLKRLRSEVEERRLEALRKLAFSREARTEETVRNDTFYLVIHMIGALIKETDGK